MTVIQIGYTQESLFVVFLSQALSQDNETKVQSKSVFIIFLQLCESYDQLYEFQTK